MVIRLLGAALVVAAAGTMGAMGALGLRRRVASLEGLIVSLELMENEICSRLTPMVDVLDMLSQTAPETVRGFYRRASGHMSAIGRCSFYAIWRGAVEGSRELRLRPEEAQCLSELGLCLGRYDVKEQAEAIGRVRRRLEVFLKRAEEESARDGKLHAIFGVVSGLFAAVILL